MVLDRRFTTCGTSALKRQEIETISGHLVGLIGSYDDCGTSALKRQEIETTKELPIYSREPSSVGLPLLRGRKLKPSLGTAAGTAGSCGVRLRLSRGRGSWSFGTLYKYAECEELRGGDMKAENVAEYHGASAACRKR